MNRWLKIGILGLLALAAVTLAVSGTAFAQDETPAPEVPDFEGRLPFHRGGFLPRGEVFLEAAADALGMSAEELQTQLWGGKTLADLAEENGVDLADVQDAVEAAREAAMREGIATAVENGVITQEHADWLLEGLDQGFIGKFAPGGFLGGHGGRGPRGGFMFPSTETAAPSGDA